MSAGGAIGATTEAPLAQLRGGGAGSPAPRLSVPDMRSRLEQVRRETREMKAMESQMKFTMRREEEKAKKAERLDDQKELMEWQQEQKRVRSAAGVQRLQEAKVAEVQESRGFQEFKRSAKQAEKEVDNLLITDLYVECKDHSEWRVVDKMKFIVEEERLVIEANLEKYKTVAEASLAELQREQEAQAFSEQERLQQEMKQLMDTAKAEREQSLHALEFVRAHKDKQVRAGTHLPSRPACRRDQV